MKNFSRLTLIILFFCLSCGQKSQVTVDSAGGQTAGCGSMNSDACETFGLINAQRIANRLEPFKILPTCVKMAQEHADDMIARGYFSHDSPTETFAQRVKRYGLDQGWVGENIAQAGSAQAAVSAWMNSPGHKANILNTSFRSSGLGFNNGDWVQCFSSLE